MANTNDIRKILLIKDRAQTDKSLTVLELGAITNSCNAYLMGRMFLGLHLSCICKYGALYKVI